MGSAARAPGRDGGAAEKDKTVAPEFRGLLRAGTRTAGLYPALTALSAASPPAPPRGYLRAPGLALRGTHRARGAAAPPRPPARRGGSARGGVCTSPRLGDN